MSVVAEPKTTYTPFSYDGVRYLAQIVDPDMMSHGYSVLVAPFFANQFRIRLCDTRTPDMYAPPGHGAIIREMCTYKQDTLRMTLLALRSDTRVLEYVETIANTLNCESLRGRIRLDTELPDWDVCPNCSKRLSDFSIRGCSSCDRRR